MEKTKRRSIKVLKIIIMKRMAFGTRIKSTPKQATNECNHSTLQ